MSGDIFRFSCACGAVLSARRSMVGKKGKCARCEAVLEIPDPATVQVSASAEAIAVQEICSVCQTPIDEDDARTTCKECDVPYHVECWEENLGCAVYGCRNVNILKLGPDISIPAPAAVWGGIPQPTTAAPPPPPMITPEESFPWDYLCLGAAALSVPIGMFTCGAPSMFTVMASLAVFALGPNKQQWGATVASVVVSLLGGLFGFLLSVLFWTSRFVDA